MAVDGSWTKPSKHEDLGNLGTPTSSHSWWNSETQYTGHRIWHLPWQKTGEQLPPEICRAFWIIMTSDHQLLEPWLINPPRFHGKSPGIEGNWGWFYEQMDLPLSTSGFGKSEDFNLRAEPLKLIPPTCPYHWVSIATHLYLNNVSKMKTRCNGSAMKKHWP